MPIVRIEAAISAILLALTWLASSLAGIPILDRIAVSPGSLAAGVAGGLLLASMAPLCTAPWASRVPVLRDLNRICAEFLIPMTRNLRFIDMVALAVLSGVSEELFFRGVLQPILGLTVASVLFGLLHWLGLVYAAWAASVGVLLGLVYTTTGNLVVPATMHTVHNLAVLLYLRYRRVEPT
jgi:membrane protease YdiL (CAAX protease family)